LLVSMLSIQGLYPVEKRNAMNTDTQKQQSNKSNESPSNIQLAPPAVEGPTLPPATIQAIDSYFTVEHQGMIASKYRAKYSDAEQREHKTTWPAFTGNHFTLYILAETLSEARKAVFSRDKKIYLSRLIGTMEVYTPTVPGAVLSELQIACNRTTDLKLAGMFEQVTFEDNRSDLLKDYAKTLKLASKTGKDTDTAKAKFFHAAAALGITANSIW